MSGIRNFDFETHCYELSAKRKRKQTEEEYEAFTLMMLSCDHRSSYTGRTTSPPTAENIEDKINPATAVTNISERTAPLASSDDKKPVKHFSPAITASPLAKNLSHTCNECGRSFSTGQALGGHKSSHRDRPPILAKKSIANTSKRGASTHALEGHIHMPCPHDFDLNLPAAPEVDVQVLGEQNAENHIPCKKQRLDE
ncbi:Zinc finger protein ZAT10 [Abeliophyllum distichum]|uniref:Zinc finger protein ZAT10 n=1 Tax=Abeliophyllum distichum TaxID=126358 RepID=A0ABD1RR30_9LAMI